MDRIAKLEEQIVHHRNLYYNEQPEISDDDFDKLVDKLKKLKPSSPVLQQVGSVPSRAKIALPYTLGSLDKVTPATVKKWLLAQKDDIVVTPKIDGLSIFAQWNKGKLKMLTTRGDANIGMNLLHKADKIKDIILKLKQPINISVRGEAFCTKLPPGYKTKRNAASGILNRDDAKGLEHINILFHELIHADNMPDTEIKRLKFLIKHIPCIIEYGIIHKSELTVSMVDSIIAEMIDEIKESKLKSPCEIDGLVLTKNISARENVEYPKNKIAFKVQDAPRATKVKEIEWNVGRTGRVVPIVHIDTVEKDGVEINHPTGHNYKWLRDRGIGVGAVINVVRSGDVIPYITDVVKPVPIKIGFSPNYCPSCKKKLSIEGVHLVCTNTKCRGQALAFIEYFIRALGAEGISVATLDKLGVNTVEDFYNLTKENIAKVGGLGDISADNIIAERNKTLTTTEEDLLTAFGIPNIGPKIALKIVDKYFRGKFEAIFEIEPSVLYNMASSIDLIGPVKAEDFVANIYDYDELYAFLVDKGLKFKKEKRTKKLEGETYQFTGTMSKPREELEKLVILNGGSIASVSRNLKYLVIADPNSTSTKAQKARKLGVKMISEEDFLKRLK